MKQKRITRKSVCFLLFLGSVFILLLVFFRGPIRLPNVDEITRIEMSAGRTYDYVEIEITNVEDIEIVMTALSSATVINRFGANNDFPPGEGALRISPLRMFDGEEGVSNRLFLFIDNESGNEYLWQSYVGVYRLSEENINVIRQLFEVIVDNQN